MTKKIFFITGASGVGKTTLIEQLKKKYSHKKWGFLHFDSIGVPSVEEMVKEYGSPSDYQKAMTFKWIDALIHNDDYDCIFFEGQVNLQFIRQGFALHHFTDFKIILVDCSEDEMTYRLTHKRGQPELLTNDMKNWLKFLRNQAKELNVQVIDTTESSIEEVVSKFDLVVKLEGI
jgi:broad-specificity NMP kinase